jgi:hypothetical protein
MQGAEILANALCSPSCHLRLLDIGNTGCGVKGLMAICEALAEHNTSLESLSLENCLVQSPPQQATVHSLTKMLRRNGTLRQLYLAQHGLRDDDFAVRCRCPFGASACVAHAL